MKHRFDIIYAPQIKQHLKTIQRKYYSLIRKTIEEQLQSEPDTETTNRKPMKYPGVYDAEWEIRFGPDNRFRVLYEINREYNEVHILAIGMKQRNQLIIAGKEVRQ
ncbi:MAG: addiction module toxin RelE [Deltaproteobacteria bacterium]|nr:MAG: addiction module toxin RelE [Deltaproteobacteria bacterium]